jgi:hypothetical protein
VSQEAGGSVEHLEFLDVSVSNLVATVTLRRPPVNALSAPMMREITRMFTALAGTALSVARVIAGKSPLALRLAKQAMNRVEHLPLEDGYQLEQDYTARISRFDDAVEARRAPPREARPDLELALKGYQSGRLQVRRPAALPWSQPGSRGLAVPGDPGSGGSGEHPCPVQAAVEDPHELPVMSAVIAEDEALEVGFALGPAVRAPAGQLRDVGQVGRHHLIADLADSPDMPGQAH